MKDSEDGHSAGETPVLIPNTEVKPDTSVVVVSVKRQTKDAVFVFFNMGYKFEKTSIPEVVLIRNDLFGDARGFFMETYRKPIFTENGIDTNFVQLSHSRSGKNVLRGLHYQVDPKTQGKLVRCIRGEVFDVAVDIRKDSTTFGKWVGVNLSEENHNQIYIPPGFAHGFCVMSDVAELLYAQTEEYSQAHERGVIWNDPILSIAWPISSPILAERDSKFPRLECV